MSQPIQGFPQSFILCHTAWKDYPEVRESTGGQSDSILGKQTRPAEMGLPAAPTERREVPNVCAGKNA